MKKYIFKTFFITQCLCLYLFGSGISAASLETFRARITEHTLSNGLHFIILQDNSAPVVSFHVHVKTGSVNEQAGETGISHIIEHLAFNGTKTIGTTNWQEEKRLLEAADNAYKNYIDAKATGACLKTTEELYREFVSLKEQAASYSLPNEFGTILDRHGAVGPNAYCSYDMTAYWVELPSNKTELWAMLESDRLFNPVFRGFYEEMEVIKEERRMRVDNSPWGRLMEEFAGAAYRLHPYRHPIIGYPADLDTITREMVKRFYEKHYVPSNMVIAVAGDVSPETFIPLAEKYFGNIPRSKPFETPVAKEPSARSEKRVTVRMDAQPLFLAGYLVSKAGSSDIPALEICSEILAGGRTSRIYRRLVLEEKIAVAAGSWCWAPQYPGIFYVWAVPAQNVSTGALETAIFEEIEKIRQGAIDDRELEGAKARKRMSLLTSLKSRRGLIRELAWYHAITGTWENLFHYARAIEQVTAEDIKQAAEKYFFPCNRITATLEKSEENQP